MNEISENVFCIPAANLPALREKIEKLNRRARRLDCTPIGLSVGPIRTSEKTQIIRVSGAPDTARKVRVAVHDVTITGERPRLPGGWYLVARLQLLDGVTIAHTVPGETIPRELQNATNRCDHCHTSRARNDVYVVRDANATNMVVGSTCISDFLGGVTPTQLAWYAEAMTALDCREYENVGGGFGGGFSNMDIERYLTASACAIRLVGWIARSAVKYSGALSTSDYASDIYFGRLYMGADGKVTGADLTRYGTANPRVVVGEADEKEAAAALTWAQAIDPATANDYLLNVHKVADLSYAPWNLSGIAASIVSAYQREQGRLAVANRDKVTSLHVGTKGDKLKGLMLTVARINSFESRFGTTHLHTMKDSAGNVFKWFASTEQLREGSVYEVCGTVKDHSEYKGVAETVLTRCKAKLLSKPDSVAESA